MKHKVLIIDTSIMCVWLNVPGYLTAGPDNDKWDFQRVDTKIKEEQEHGTLFVLPLATIIETGNHITHIKTTEHEKADRHKYAKALVEIINKSADENFPWTAFSAQNKLWEAEKLKEVADRWLGVVDVLSFGDISIVDVADYYCKMGVEVELLTGDQGLKSYQPVATTVPRRRR